MYLKQIVDEIGDYVNDTTLKSDGANASRTKAWVREAYYLDIISLRQDWWFLEKQGTLTTVDEYTTGSASVTKGSTAVTGSGTVWVSSHVGNMLVINGKSKRVATVGSNTSITLEDAWEDDSASGASYSLVKDRFDLPRWLDVKRIREIKEDGTCPLEGVSIHQADNSFTGRGGIGTPKYFVPNGRSRTSYSTGTISGTLDAKVLTGDSTAWTTSGIEQFDVIKVGSYAYTVNTVDSDTQITLYEDLAATIDLMTSYEAVIDRYRVKLYPFPKFAKTLRITASSDAGPLNDDSDIPLLPDVWHHILVKGGVIRALKHNNDPGVQLEMAEYQTLIRRLAGQNARDDYRTDSWWRP